MDIHGHALMFVGAKLGQLGYVGNRFASLWDHLGVVLDSRWNYFGVISGVTLWVSLGSLW